MNRQDPIYPKSTQTISNPADFISCQILHNQNQEKNPCQLPNNCIHGFQYNTKSERNDFFRLTPFKVPDSPSNVKFKWPMARELDAKNSDRSSFQPMVSEMTYHTTLNDLENPRSHSNTTGTSMSVPFPEIDQKKIQEQDEEELFNNSMEIEFNNDENLLEPFRRLEIVDFNHFSKEGSFGDCSFELPKNKKEQIIENHQVFGVGFQHFSQHSRNFDGLSEQLSEEILKPINEEINSNDNTGMLIEGDNQKNKKSTKTCCTCKKSKCLQRYCECFRLNGFCSADCACTECYNRSEFKEVRDEFYAEQLKRNPHSFASKIVNLSSAQVYAKGCKCKKTECVKNYCECFAAGVKCTNLCKCCECHNFDETVQIKDFEGLHDQSSRKKKKSDKNFQEAFIEKIHFRKFISESSESNCKSAQFFESCQK